MLSTWQGLEAKRNILLGDFNAALDFDDGFPSVGILQANDLSSATRRTGRNDCNRDAPAGFAAAHG
jgi:hypothetical protein